MGISNKTDMTKSVPLLACAAMIFVAACTVIQDARLAAPTKYGLEELAPNVYVSSDVDARQRHELLDAIEEARNRVAAIYGSRISDPPIYACSTRKCFESFGGRGDGYAIRGTGILLIPKSFVAHAISHEWSHVELQARIGRSHMGTVPLWFNEGLAVVVGDYPGHSEAIWQEAVANGYPIPPLDDLRSFGQWIAAFKKYPNPKGLNVVYASAGHEVRSWLQQVRLPGLLALIEAVKGGEKFSAAYSRLAVTTSDRTGITLYENTE